MSRTFIFVILAAILGSAAALGQSATNNSSTNPPAVTSGDADSKTSAAPVPGKNSFTNGQVRKRLHDHGYRQIKDLKLDDQGIWRGAAQKDGKPVNVAVDYQGNITEQ
jgi:hypothetical protein